jgi:chromosomal replication initiation ATPase DnaA
MTDYKPSYAFIRKLAEKYNFNPLEEYIQFKTKTTGLDTVSKKDFSVYATELTETLNVNIDDILSPCRKRELVLPRHLLRHITYANGVGSLSEIARLTGARGHDTVIHSIRTSTDLINVKDKEYMRYYTPLAHLLNGK